MDTKWCPFVSDDGLPMIQISKWLRAIASRYEVLIQSGRGCRNVVRIRFVVLAVYGIISSTTFQPRKGGDMACIRGPLGIRIPVACRLPRPFVFPSYTGSLLLAVDLQVLPRYNDLTIGGYGCIVAIAFEWDPNKAAGSVQKHGVTFQEAATVFQDDLSVTVPDPDHSMEEERFITVGMSSQNRLLMIAHAGRGDRIRSISARELTPRERRQYEEADWNG
jgi:uncharacterized DUF497 family protein